MKVLVCSFLFCVVLMATTSAQAPRINLFSDSSSDTIADSQIYMESSLSILDFQFSPGRICTLGMWLFYSESNFNGSISQVGESETQFCRAATDVASVRSFGDSTDVYRSSISFIDSDGELDGPYYDNNATFIGSIDTIIATGSFRTGIAMYTLPDFAGLKYCFQIEEFNVGRYLDNFPEETGVPSDFFKSFAFEPIDACTSGKKL